MRQLLTTDEVLAQGRVAPGKAGPNMSNNKDFGTVLRELRKAKGVYLGDLAEKLGLAASYLSDVELGRRHPFKIDVIEKVAMALNLSKAESQALTTAALVQRGGFELPVDAHNQAAIDAGAALMREWPKLSTDELRQLQAFAEKLTADKKPEN